MSTPSEQEVRTAITPEVREAFAGFLDGLNMSTIGGSPDAFANEWNGSLSDARSSIRRGHFDKAIVATLDAAIDKLSQPSAVPQTAEVTREEVAGVIYERLASSKAAPFAAFNAESAMRNKYLYVADAVLSLFNRSLSSSVPETEKRMAEVARSLDAMIAAQPVVPIEEALANVDLSELFESVPETVQPEGDVAEALNAIETESQCTKAFTDAVKVLRRSLSSSQRQPATAAGAEGAAIDTSHANVTALLNVLENEMDYVMEQPLEGDRMALTVGWRRHVEQWLKDSFTSDAVSSSRGEGKPVIPRDAIVEDPAQARFGIRNWVVYEEGGKFIATECDICIAEDVEVLLVRADAVSVSQEEKTT